MKKSTKVLLAAVAAAAAAGVICNAVRVKRFKDEWDWDLDEIDDDDMFVDDDIEKEDF